MIRSIPQRLLSFCVVVCSRKPTSTRRRCVPPGTSCDAVHYMLKRETVFDMEKFLHGSAEHSGGAWRLTGQRRDEPASGTLKALFGCVCQRQGVHRPCIPEPLPLIGHPLWLLYIRRESFTVPVCCPSPEP